MHSKGSWHGLGGASRKETTRDEIIAQAKAERAARNEARQRAKAAVIIQSHWRSYAAKKTQRQQLLQQWQERYAAAAAQPDTLLTAVELQSGAIRLLLMALLPLGSSRSTQKLETGQPLQFDADTCSRNGPGGSGGGGSGLAAVAVRGTIALVLRSFGSNQQEQRYTSLAASADAKAWLVQAVHLCHLCCLVVAANSVAANPVLDAAATRLLQLLSEPAGRCETSVQHSSTAGSCIAQSPALAPQAGAVPDVLSGLCQQPMPLLRAVQRLALQRGMQQQQRSVGTPVPALDAATVSAAGLQRLLGVVLKVLETWQPAAAGHAQPQGQQQYFVQQFILVVLTAPGLASAIPAAVKAQLLQQPLLQGLLLPMTQQLAASGKLAGLDALHCLVNLAQLLTGCGPAATQQSRQQMEAGKPQHLEDHDTAVAYCSAAVQLLSAAGKQAKPSYSKADNSRNGSIVPCSGSTAADQQGDNGHLATPRTVAEVLQDGCWLLGTQAHLLQLMRVLTSSSQDGIVTWAAYCTHLLQDSRSDHSKPANVSPTGGDSDSKNSNGLSQAMLNVLSFAPGVLPAMWRWLAMTAGLPLEAPLQASRGLDIAAVARGPDGLQENVALVLGLFCRSVAQLLLVLDDADLHQHQTPFSLGTSRAIASTLNSLVFHTAFPDMSKTQQQQLPQQPPVKLLPATASYGMALLRDYAPVVLRGYYERDARQSFCQPNLWTEPYSNLMTALESQQKAQPGGVMVTTAAVVQALLVSAGLTGSDEANDSNVPTGPPQRNSSSAVTAAAGPTVPGLRTNALLSLLKAAPQCVPFPVRLELFRQMLAQDKSRGRWQLSPAEGGPVAVKLTVRRDVLLEDAYRALGRAGQAIKGRLMVTFVNAQGVPEAGLDHGGLMKELLEQVVAAGTQPEYGLFTATEGTGLMYPNPAAEAIPGGLGLLEFLGMMVGKALYDGILLNLAFAPFFLKALQGGRAGVDDLAGLDSTLHANLLAVKACPAEQVECLGLTFLAEQQLFGKTVQFELIPGGDSVPVTADNRLLYVHLMADYHLNTRLGRAAAAFASGLSVVLPPAWLRMFSPSEFNQLISGGKDGGLDVDDMAKYAHYSNGYTESSHTIKMFWRVVDEFTPQQRSALLRFITSTSRAPLGGFKHLQPPLTIHKVDCGGSPLAMIGVGKDVDRLPSASTCYNMLKLPNYKKRITMKEKLLYAIQSGAGFELS